MTTDNPNNQDRAETDVDSDTEELAEELGSIVFESALMQYLADAEEGETKAFEAYVDEHVSEDNFLEELCEKFPAFKECLGTEMAVMQADVKEITSGGN